MNINEFITFLIDNNLVTNNITEDTDEAFWNRFRIQKYALIAKRLGLIDKDYYYDIYIYGPYSSKLADEYYKYERVNYNIPKDKADIFYQ